MISAPSGSDDVSKETMPERSPGPLSPIWMPAVPVVVPSVQPSLAPPWEKKVARASPRKVGKKTASVCWAIFRW